MNQTLKLTTKQAKVIVKATFPQYTGRKFKIEFTDKITFYDTNWGGGSRNYYAAVSSDGKTIHLHVPAPWVNPVEGATLPMPEDALIVEHSIFCGQDMGIRIYAHPCHLPKWIEAPKP